MLSSAMPINMFHFPFSTICKWWNQDKGGFKSSKPFHCSWERKTHHSFQYLANITRGEKALRGSVRVDATSAETSWKSHLKKNFETKRIKIKERVTGWMKEELPSGMPFSSSSKNNRWEVCLRQETQSATKWNAILERHFTNGCWIW